MSNKKIQETHKSISNLNHDVAALNKKGKLLEEDLMDLYTCENNMLEVCASENLHIETVVSKVYIPN